MPAPGVSSTSTISNEVTAECVVRETRSRCAGCRMPSGQTHVDTKYHIYKQCRRHQNSRPPQSCYPDLNDRTGRGISQTSESRCPQCQARPRRVQVRAVPQSNGGTFYNRVEFKYYFSRCRYPSYAKLRPREVRTPSARPVGDVSQATHLDLDHLGLNVESTNGGMLRCAESLRNSPISV